MNDVTLQALIDFPRQLEAHYALIPVEFKHWTPLSWEGVPSEPFSAIEQICHVRDIETDGYHRRLQRTLDEVNPILPGVDGVALASARSYATANADEVFASFRSARSQTLAILTGITTEQYRRPAVFDGHATSLRGLVHYLCSHDQQHLAGLQWLLGRIEAYSAELPA